MKILIDTNVILDFCLNRERFIYSKSIFESAENNKLIGIIGAQSIPIIYFYLKQALTHHQAIEFIKDLSQKFHISDLTLKIIKSAIELEFPVYEDALLADTAYYESCDYIVTNNYKDFKKSKVKAIKPDQFVKEFVNT